MIVNNNKLMMSIATTLLSIYSCFNTNYVFGARTNNIHSMTFPNCDAVWNKREIILASYQDWTIKQSKDISAEVRNTNHAYGEKKAVEVYFKPQNKTDKRPQLVLKSKELSSLKFNSIKAVSLHLKANLDGQVRVILRDANGHMFFSKNPILIHHNNWFEEKRSTATDAVVFHGNPKGRRDNFAPKSPFTIDHIKIGLPNNYNSNGNIAFTGIGVFGLQEIDDAKNSKSPYAEWVNKNCNYSSTSEVNLKLNILPLTKLLRTGSNVPIIIAVNNNTNKDTSLLVSVNRFGNQNKYLQNIIFRTQARDTIKKELLHPFNHPGLYAVSVILKDNKGKLLAKESRKVMVWDPPGNDYKDNVPTFFGMMYHDKFTKSIWKDFDLMAEAGVKIVRFPFRWSEIQPRQNEYHWHNYDKLMKRIKAKGMIAQPMLFYTPNWAARKLDNTRHAALARKRPQWITPGKPEDVAHFVGIAAKRYSNQPVVWELYNEPSEKQHWIGGDERDYVSILKSVSHKLRSSSPNAKLITAGIGITATQNKIFADYLAKNINGLTDGFAIHAYGNEMNAAMNIEAAHKMLTNFSDNTSVWLNETGYLVDASEPGGELRRSAALAKTATISRYLGSNNFTWFIFKNYPASANSATDNYAIKSADGSVRPPILAYANAVKQLSKAKPIRELGIGKAIRGYEFSIGTKRLLVTWLPHEYGEEHFQPPLIDGMSISGIYDVFGGTINADDETMQLKQEHYPIFIIYDNKPDKHH